MLDWHVSCCAGAVPLRLGVVNRPALQPDRSSLFAAYAVPLCITWQDCRRRHTLCRKAQASDLGCSGLSLSFHYEGRRY